MIGCGPRVLPAGGPLLNACDGYPGGDPATDDDDAGPGWGPEDCWAEDGAFGAEDEEGGWVWITCTWEWG